MFNIFPVTLKSMGVLQLPMQSVPITTNVMSSNPAHGEVYMIQHYVTNLIVSDLLQVGDILGILCGFLHQ